MQLLNGNASSAKLERQRSFRILGFLQNIVSRFLRLLPGYDAYRLYREREKYILEEGYQRSKLTGVGKIDPLPSLLRRFIPSIAPSFYIFSGGQKTLVRIADFGEGDFADPRAREPHARVIKATGTTTIVNMVGEPAKAEKIKIITHLARGNYEDLFNISMAFGSNITNTWDVSISFQNNITFLGANIIGKCFLGIPEVPMRYIPLLRQSNDLISAGDPDSPEFAKKFEEIFAMSNDLLEKYGEEVIAVNKYICAQFSLTGSETAEQRMKLLKDSHGGGGLIVESNLSTIIMHAMAHVSQNPAVLNRLLNELDHAGVISGKEDLKKLTYLECIYRETLRHLSPTAVIPRVASKAFILPVENDQGATTNCHITPNSFLFFAIRKIHHDPAYWEHPEQFNPSRFESRVKAGESKFMGKNYYPFSGGKRGCPAGNGFVEIAFKALLVGFFQKYQLELNKPLEQIPINTVHPRWHQEYFAVIKNRELSTRSDNTLIDRQRFR